MSLPVPEPLTPALSLDGATVYHADCLVALRALPDCSIDSIVSDPPYEIGFMGKAWDGTGIAYSVGLWAECLRVLKPGGHLLAFGATRSYHRMTVAIEDAGFEIRDSIHWTYGSGFPKSLDVSKAIDKQAGAERKTVGSARSGSTSRAYQSEEQTTSGEYDITAPATSDAATWQGWGTALKPSHEPIVVARRPLVGTVAQTVLAHGTGALNIDGCRVGNRTRTNSTKGAGSNGIYNKFGPLPTEIKDHGRWPANTVLTHAAGCRATGETRTDDITLNGEGNDNHFRGNFKGGHDQSPKSASVPVFACVPGCPIAELDRQSGKVGAAAPASGPTYSGPSKSNCMAGAFKGNGDTPPAFHNDSGGASRFFTCTEWSDTWDAPAFLYVAKPAKKERNAGLDGLPEKSVGAKGNGLARTCATCGANVIGGCECPDRTFVNPVRQNHHPTVKPVALMRHLVRLVTPPGGVVLDPFLGSGTTAVAAVLEGFRFTGCEMTQEYFPIIEGRVRHAVANRPVPPVDLFSEAAE